MTKISSLSLPDSSAERDLQKVLQQLEPQISFLEELTKMGGAMRTVMTKILTNQQAFKELCMGKYLPYYSWNYIIMSKRMLPNFTIDSCVMLIRCILIVKKYTSVIYKH